MYVFSLWKLCHMARSSTKMTASWLLPRTGILKHAVFCCVLLLWRFEYEKHVRCVALSHGGAAIYFMLCQPLALEIPGAGWDTSNDILSKTQAPSIRLYLRRRWNWERIDLHLSGIKDVSRAIEQLLLFPRPPSNISLRTISHLSEVFPQDSYSIFTSALHKKFVWTDQSPWISAFRTLCHLGRCWEV